MWVFEVKLGIELLVTHKTSFKITMFLSYAACVIACAFVALFIQVSNSFQSCLRVKTCRTTVTSMVDIDSADDIDPNFEAHLPSLLKVGLQERPSPELATKLRERFKQITVVKKEAAKALKEINEELAVEVLYYHYALLSIPQVINALLLSTRWMN